MRIVIIRRCWLATAGCLCAAATILCVAANPMAVGAAAEHKALPIYSVAVPGNEKVVALTFDAAWGDVRMRQFGFVPDCRISMGIKVCFRQFCTVCKNGVRVAGTRWALAGLSSDAS